MPTRGHLGARVSDLCSADGGYVGTRKAATLASAAAVLAELDEAARANAVIQIEPIGSQRSAAHLARAAEIVMWRNGRFSRDASIPGATLLGRL